MEMKPSKARKRHLAFTLAAFARAFACSTIVSIAALAVIAVLSFVSPVRREFIDVVTFVLMLCSVLAIGFAATAAGLDRESR